MNGCSHWIPGWISGMKKILMDAALKAAYNAGEKHMLSHMDSYGEDCIVVQTGLKMPD